MNSRRLTYGGVLGCIAVGTSLLSGYLSVLAAQQPITEDSVPQRAVAIAGYYASGAEPDKRDPRSKFVDEVAAVIECVHEHYAVEIPHAQLLDWAVQQIYARLERIVPVKISERLDGTLRLDGKGLRELLGLVADDWKDELRRCTDLAFDGILRHLDERCEIFSSGWSFRCILRVYNPVGIGVRLAREPAAGRIQVWFPIRGSPAYVAGLRSGDVIEEIHRPPDSSEEAQTISPRGLTLTRAYQELQGKPGGTVHLKVARPGVARILQFDVEHKRVREESVLGLRYDRKHDWEHWLDPARKIAYLRVTRFGHDTAQDFARILDGLRRQGLKALVLDLRFNEGGLMNSGVRTTELLVGEAPICSIVFRGQVQDRFVGEHGKTPLSCPIACLVNRHTARMAEVVAAALQDNKRAVMVGERTRGDAAVETLINTGQNYALRVTRLMYYRPGGRKLAHITTPDRPRDEWGVTPDMGYTLTLSGPEGGRLRAELDGAMAIPPAGQTTAKAKPAWTDRQLELALMVVRDQLNKGNYRNDRTKDEMDRLVSRLKGLKVQWFSFGGPFYAFEHNDVTKAIVAVGSPIIPSLIKRLDKSDEDESIYIVFCLKELNAKEAKEKLLDLNRALNDRTRFPVLHRALTLPLLVESFLRTLEIADKKGRR